MNENDLSTPLCFIGPRSENRPYFAEILQLIFNDHIFWRRNFHPQDPPALNYSQLKNSANTQFQDHLVQELFKLMAELKFDPPFFSPRYMAHMLSEPLIPGLIAYIATIFYNPNNVASEAAPVTMKYENEVAQQLACMFGFDSKESFGHLTSGGTVANYQSLYYNINLRFLPLSFAMSLLDNGIELKNESFPNSLHELLNISYENYSELEKRYKKICQRHGLEENSYLAMTITHLGLRDFEEVVYDLFNEDFPHIKVIVPASAHYSWSRGVKLLGLGTRHLVKVKLNENMQMDIADLKEKISYIKANNCIILQLVGVFGTTESGSFDAIDEIMQVRDNCHSEGLYYPVHIDAAYGGYFSSIFIERHDPLLPFENADWIKKQHHQLQYCDSITVDPHKLGFSPYGAGAFIFRQGLLKKYITEDAKYCFNPQGRPEPQVQLGMHILEGSKPGAIAAAVYFNHKIVSLNAQGYGRILTRLCQTAQSFYQKLQKFSYETYKLVTLSPPQSNIVCFFVKDSKRNKLSQINEMTRKLAQRFGIKDVKSIQEYDYIVSNTTLSLNYFSAVPKTLTEAHIDSQELILVRMVFMNQFHTLEDHLNKNHLDYFLEEVESFIKANHNHSLKS